MQVELLGSTGAGKSTLAAGILQACREQNIDAWMGDDFVLKQARLNSVRSYFTRTLLLDLISLFGCLVSCRNCFRFHLLVVRIISRLPSTVPFFEKLNIVRNTLKKIGIYEITRRCASDRQVVFLDEGTLHTAHYLFVHVSVEPNMGDLATFISLVPLPDMAIYVKQDEAVLVERTLARGHRRIRGDSSARVQRFVKRAVDVFEILSQQSALKRRCLVVDGTRHISTSRNDQDGPVPAISREITGAIIEAVNSKISTIEVIRGSRT